MDQKTKDTILLQAVIKWGLPFNLDILKEELSEVSIAVNKLDRINGIKNFHIMKPTKETSMEYSLKYFALCSEVANAKLVLRKLELLLDPEAVAISEERKILRLKDRIEANNTEKA